jgi:hypothetical protein
MAPHPDLQRTLAHDIRGRAVKTPYAPRLEPIWHNHAQPDGQYGHRHESGDVRHQHKASDGWLGWWDDDGSGPYREENRP